MLEHGISLEGDTACYLGWLVVVWDTSTQQSVVSGKKYVKKYDGKHTSHTLQMSLTDHSETKFSFGDVTGYAKRPSS